MLPGFRFLFAAILLSVSLFIFGIGAASLLRAAHQAFASNPNWRGAPEVNFAQKSEANPPVLAALRVDPPILDKPPSVAAVAITSPTAIAAQPAPAAPETAPAEVTAPAPANAPPVEIAKADVPKPEQPVIDNSPAPEAAAQTTDAPVKSDAPRMAAITVSEAPPADDKPAVVQPEPAKPVLAPADPAPSPQASGAISKIATLGGPPVEIVPEAPAKKEKAKSARTKEEPSALKKHAQERHVAHRKRLSARARLAAQQVLQQQQQTDPFAQPWPGQTATPATTTPTRVTRRR